MTTMSQQQTAAPAPPASRLAKWAPLAVILCGTFVYILDFFVVNVALPDIQHSLHASAAAIEWLVAALACRLCWMSGSATFTTKKSRM